MAHIMTAIFRDFRIARIKDVINPIVINEAIK